MASSFLNMPQFASTCTAKEKLKASTSMHRCPATLEGFAATPHRQNAQCDDPAGTNCVTNIWENLSRSCQHKDHKDHCNWRLYRLSQFQIMTVVSFWFMALMIASKIRRLHGLDVLPAATARIPGRHLPAMAGPSKVWRQGCD